jgi:hypothetical protein
MEFSSFPLPPSLVSLEHPASSALCSFSVPCLLFSFVLFYFVFFVELGSVSLRDYAGLSHGWLWEYRVMLICSPVGLLDVSQAGLEVAAGSWEALLFSECNVAWRSFVRLRFQGVEAMIPLGPFFLPSVVPASQEKF